ncbi:MAG: phosphoenolpyruvate--protein phosphotransferase [Acidobacteria bacterium]|jgi:phosphotransferase system enzyme I (PtsI)|nr:MAG: phosphoenolpyruvate--protein phosphotransferase [Acidobacteriota bacterium]GIU83094.1 MAG: phosphoenolpyruvate-protein phosphotransferase [Pyrinomonadaceae bacterium]
MRHLSRESEFFASSEIHLKGRAVSRGIGIGKIVRLYSRRGQFYRIKITKEKELEKEIRRFRAAVRLAKRHLQKLILRNTAKTQADILETHALILEDKSFLERIEAVIRHEGVNAEWAVEQVADSYMTIYRGLENENLRERYIDIKDVAERILSVLARKSLFQVEIGEDTVLAVEELKPSTLVALESSGLRAIISENGGWTSHAFIIARELGIPAVTGLKGFLRWVSNGQTVIVDGYSGQVILNPSAETLEKFRDKADSLKNWLMPERHSFKSLSEEFSENPKTLDGKEIKILVNLDFPASYYRARNYGAKGVGLYRSEFLFNLNEGFPSESEQVSVYRQISELVGEHKAKIRTFDLNLESVYAEEKSHEKNPALGLRAIRLSLSYKSLFRQQIRAILRASVKGNLDIVLPMVSDVSEILKVKKIINQEKNRLTRKGIEFGEPSLGVMVEVPSAVFVIEEILQEVDFINLGTNDLIQYLLAVDRDNETAANWFRTLHPAVLRAISKVLSEANKKGIPAIVCGEMASSIAYAPILVGLGATELSMNVNSIPSIRRVISNIAYEEAEAIAKKLLSCRTAEEAEKLMRQEFSKKWQHLYPEDFFRKGFSALR